MKHFEIGALRGKVGPWDNLILMKQSPGCEHQRIQLASVLGERRGVPVPLAASVHGIANNGAQICVPGCTCAGSEQDAPPCSSCCGGAGVDSHSAMVQLVLPVPCHPSETASTAQSHGSVTAGPRRHRKREEVQMDQSCSAPAPWSCAGLVGSILQCPRSFVYACGTG